MEGNQATFSLRRLLALSGMAAIGTSGLVIGLSTVASADSEISISKVDDFTKVEATSFEEQLVATFTDPGFDGTISPTSACNELANQTYRAEVDKNSSGTFSLSGIGIVCGSNLFKVLWSTTSDVYPDSGSFPISIRITDTGDSQTATKQTTTATITDRALNAGTASNVSGTEGTTITVHATFEDTNHFWDEGDEVDSGLTASVSWGDGSTSSGTVGSGGSSPNNVAVSASHVYDANKPASSVYNVSVTLTDDGGKTATDQLTASIADAALTAGPPKSFTTPAGGQASNAVVASFTDAAGGQAAAADFTASIKWGDGTTSSGTLTKTGTGSFNVSGSHTYATAGTKSLTVTVTDEEGQTVTIVATATVPALPLTGKGPQNPASPGTWVLLAVILVGASLTAVGGIRVRR